MHSPNARVVFSDNPDYRDTVCNDISSVDEFLVGDSRGLSVGISGRIFLASLWSLSVLPESSTHVGALNQGTLKEILEGVECCLRPGGPVMGHNGCDTAEREQGCLVGRLLIRHVVLGCEDVSVNHRLIGIHSVHNDHSSALGEDGQVTDEGGWELVHQRRHREVGEQT
jgi:hypothetical protein